MRLSRIVTSLLVCYWIALDASPAHAQFLPFAPSWPVSPTDAKQCAAFAADLDGYQAAVSQQHEECLKTGKADRPNVPTDSLVCSRSACQILHDILYSDALYTDVKTLRKKVGECYDQVKEYLDRQAREKREADEREKAAADRQSAEEKRNNEDKTRMKPPEDQGTPRQQPEGGKPASAGQPTNAAATAPVSSANAATPAQPASQNSKEAPVELKDPFARAQKEAVALGMSDPRVVDPFSGSTISRNDDYKGADLTDPFAGGSSAHKEERDVPEEVGQGATEGLKKGFDMVKDSIERGKVLAKTSLSAADYRRYVQSADDAISVSSGVTYVVAGLEDAVLLKNIYEADAPEARKREAARFAIQLGKDATSYVFTRDAVKQGIENVLVRTFPEEVAPYLIKYGSATMAGAGIMFDSVEAEAPGLLRYEKWDTMSSKQKEQVLSTWWKYYDKDVKARHPNDFPTEDLKVLIDQTDALYKANLQTQ